jgi:hypothetical protein
MYFKNITSINSTMPSMDSRVGILKILKQWLQGMDLKTIFQ